MKCRVCGKEIDKFEQIEDVEIEVNNLYTDYTNTAKADVRLYCCPECTHIQTENILPDRHYENYNLMNVGNTSIDSGGNAVKRSDYYREVIDKLYELCGKKGKLLDIGCGHGTILKIADEVFEECLGIEPSEVESKIARKKGCKVINAFFDENFQEREFTAFISTQVFEHLPNPVETIKMAQTVLVPGGGGIYRCA